MRTTAIFKSLKTEAEIVGFIFLTFVLRTFVEITPGETSNHHIPC